jgi:hypothetical protein
MPSFQKFKASGEKKKKKRARAPPKDKGLKQKQKQKVIVNVSAGGSGGAGYIPVPQTPDYGSLAGLITSLRPPITQDVQIRQAPVYEPVPVKQEETIKSMTPTYTEGEMQSAIDFERGIAKSAMNKPKRKYIKKGSIKSSIKQQEDDSSIV